MNIETLYKNKWLSLINMIDVENGVHGYVYSHETRCQGKIIATLPYRKDEKGEFEYLLRNEITPCWGMQSEISSITGGTEKGKTIKQITVEELKEEGGYEVSEDDLESLGICYGTKSCDTIYHLFTVDLTWKRKGEAVGDGSELEKKDNCFWTSNIYESNDPILYVLWKRLNDCLLVEKLK